MLRTSVERKNIKIGFISDLHWGQSDTDYATRVPALVTQLNAENLDMVAICGDLTMDNSSVTSDLVTELNKLNCEWHYSFGNHDTSRENMISEMEALGIDATFPRYVHEKGYDFVFVDSGESSWGTIPTETLTWLDSTFSSRTYPIIVFLHHNVVEEDTRGLTNRDDFMAALKGIGRVEQVCSGHLHVSDRTEVINGIKYVQSHRAGGNYGLEQGFRIIKINI